MMLKKISNLKSRVKSKYAKFKKIYTTLLKLENITNNQEVFNNQYNLIIRGVQRSITTAMLHQKTFSEFKHKHKGKNVVLIATGPSLNLFKPIEDAIYVGVNTAIKYNKVKFDYLFACDNIGIKDVYDDYINYDCIKFIADQNINKTQQIPDNFTSRLQNVRFYKTDASYYGKGNHGLWFQMQYDLDSAPLGNFNTIALQALQFILYTCPDKIYLVGCDCTVAGSHFNGQNEIPDEYKEQLSTWGKDLIMNWNAVKPFRDYYYPETEIISVNPVGLKGMFSDVYSDK